MFWYWYKQHDVDLTPWVERCTTNDELFISTSTLWKFNTLMLNTTYILAVKQEIRTFIKLILFITRSKNWWIIVCLNVLFLNPHKLSCKYGVSSVRLNRNYQNNPRIEENVVDLWYAISYGFYTYHVVRSHNQRRNTSVL